MHLITIKYKLALSTTHYFYEILVSDTFVRNHLLELSTVSSSISASFTLVHFSSAALPRHRGCAAENGIL